MIKQHGVNSIIKGNLLNCNGKSYDAHDALILIKNLPGCSYNGEIMGGKVKLSNNSLQANSNARKRDRELEDVMNKSAKLPRADNTLYN